MIGEILSGTQTDQPSCHRLHTQSVPGFKGAQLPVEPPLHRIVHIDDVIFGLCPLVDTVFPFFIADVITLAVFLAFPQVITWLPNLMLN